MRQHITGLLTAWLWSQHVLQRPHAVCLPPVCHLHEACKQPSRRNAKNESIAKKDAVCSSTDSTGMFLQETHIQQ